MFVERIGKLEAGDSSPLYLQLQRRLRSAIERHVLAPDEVQGEGHHRGGDAAAAGGDDRPGRIDAGGVDARPQRCRSHVG
jgi:hypothetical protein